MPNQKTPSSTDHIIQCPSFELPESPLLSQETCKAIQDYRNYIAELMEQLGSPNTDQAALSEQERFYQGDLYKRLKAQYLVDIEEGVIGGVLTETFVPSDGITEKNKSCVLIHLHGGGFCSGSRTNSRLEAMPVAMLGKIKIISVDYRMAPEHRYPAATDDVEAVYRELLKHYKPENIGMYGASSGAQLTAMTMVRLQEKNLPLPRAVGMIAGGATRIIGDSVEYVGSMLKPLWGWI